MLCKLCYAKIIPISPFPYVFVHVNKMCRHNLFVKLSYCYSHCVLCIFSQSQKRLPPSAVKHWKIKCLPLKIDCMMLRKLNLKKTKTNKITGQWILEMEILLNANEGHCELQ